MKRLLKSIGFGVGVTAFVAAASFGLIKAVLFLEEAGEYYSLYMFVALIILVFSAAHYFGNK
jgi:hypothetical protein